ncbi:hypothetical protein [Streptomyces chryseus]|uniref:hypothetical protein n=1 Tax=Streptomyces chryseus TaxID=68186 RepID=UPI00110FF7F1|nr:hypothetical protein [Streptomyces chryseus]GGX40036.1 hypothetical protein GCM10010353_64370 [Streptomyces chryseus]
MLLDQRGIVTFCHRIAFRKRTAERKPAPLYGVDGTQDPETRGAPLASWTRAILEGLRADFVMGPEGTPDGREDTDAGQDLPDDVMQQRCDNLNPQPMPPTRTGSAGQATGRVRRLSHTVISRTGPASSRLPTHGPGAHSHTVVTSPLNQLGNTRHL